MSDEQRARLEGAAAYTRGIHLNPYPQKYGVGSCRIAWYDGYYEARIADRIGDVFERNDMTWPPTKAEMKAWRTHQIRREKRQKAK